MAQFIYLFRGGTASNRSPEEMQREMEKWRAWMQELAKSGHLKAGQPLEKGGKHVGGKKKVVTDGPYAEAKDLVGGYLLITADTLDKAVELAKGCPVLEHDGNVEVRPVQEMSM